MHQTQTLQVGAVFVRSWGYDQTTVDFYEVTEISPSGKTVKLRHVKNAAAGRGVVPAAGDDRFIDRPRCGRCPNYHYGETAWDGHEYTPVVTARLQPAGDGFRVKVCEYDHAHLWDGDPEYQTGAEYLR